MTYKQTIEYIHSVYWRGSKLGLERVAELLSRMGNPQDKLRFVHVAGTNGKGSVCAMLSSVLKEAGYRTGLYISPYIERFNERILVDSVPIPDDRLCEVTEYVRGFAESMDDLPTEFEIVCAIAFEYYWREKCDIVVLEVGLGGRLDATNVIQSPLAAVITAIDYDHMAYLGDTLEKIAAEKCGIIKSGTAVVSYEQAAEAKSVVEQKCRETNAALTFCDFSKLVCVSNTIDGQVFGYRQFESLRINLLGAHQCKNAALAVEAALALRGLGLYISDDAISNGLATASWPARFEVLCRDTLVILDGAHNHQGAEAAADAARIYMGDKEVVVLAGVLEDKQYREMLEAFDGVASMYVASQPSNPRALAADNLGRELEKFGRPVYIEPDITKAIQYAFYTAQKNGMHVLAAGSLYMAGEIRKYFKEVPGIEV